DAPRQPLRRAEHRQHRARDLDQQPRADQVQPGHADDIAALELGQQAHGLASPGRGGNAMVGGGGQRRPDSASRDLKFGVASRSNGAPPWQLVFSNASRKPPAGRASTADAMLLPATLVPVMSTWPV